MTDHHSDTSIVPHVPRLLALCQEVFDDDGEEVGVRTVAWALSLADGWTVTVPSDGAPTVSMWPSLREARHALDVFTESPTPRAQVIPQTAQSVS